MNPLEGALTNPLLTVGLQILNNNRRVPRSQYQGPFAGVTEALMGAAYQKRLMQQDALQQEQIGRQRKEDEYRDQERARREQAMGALQGMLGQQSQGQQQGQQLWNESMADEPASVQAMGAPQYPANPLNPQAIQSIMMGGDSAMQNSAITSALQGQKFNRPVVVGNSLVDIATGKPIYTAPDDPTKLTFEQHMQLAQARGGGSNLPMNWQEWQLYSQLPPEQQQAYRDMKRGPDWLNAGDQYVRPDAVVPTTPPGPTAPPGAKGTIPIELKPGEKPENKQKAAAATALGTAEGEYWASRPAAKVARESLVRDLKELRDAPGFKSIFGAIQGSNWVPDIRASAVDARAKLNKAVGAITMQGREKLQGQGAVSNFEVDMLAKASSILSNPRISDETAVQEVMKIINDLETGRYAPGSPAAAAPGAGGASPGGSVRDQADAILRGG